MPLNREHAFGDGPAYRSPRGIQLRVWLTGLLGQDRRRAAMVWKSFEHGALWANDCLLGLNAWCHNDSGDRGRVRLETGVVCRGLLRVEGFGSGSIRIGEMSYIGDDCLLSAAGGIEVGSGVLIAHGVQIFDNDSHPVDSEARSRDYKALLTGGPRESVAIAPVRIGNSAWVGFGAVILKGVQIGARAVVAAGSVVVSDVPEGTVVAGNPARVVKTI